MLAAMLTATLNLMADPTYNVVVCSVQLGCSSYNCLQYLQKKPLGLSDGRRSVCIFSRVYF
jgi:hypothetical protein